MALTLTQIYALTQEAGFSRGAGITMTAIAMAESQGDPNAHNTKGEDSRGLWQINVSSSANPDLAGMNLYDPHQNAKAAKIVYDRQGYGAWSVFTTNDPSRSYTRYLGDAQAEASKASPASIADILKALPVAGGTLADVGKDVVQAANPLEGLQTVALAISRANAWLGTPKNIGRIALVILGGAVLIMAVTKVTPNTVIKAGAKVADIAL